MTDMSRHNHMSATHLDEAAETWLLTEEALED